MANVALKDLPALQKSVISGLPQEHLQNLVILSNKPRRRRKRHKAISVQVANARKGNFQNNRRIVCYNDRYKKVARKTIQNLRLDKQLRVWLTSGIRQDNFRPDTKSVSANRRYDPEEFPLTGLDSLGERKNEVVLRAIDGKERNESRLIIPSEMNNPDILSEGDDDNERNYSDANSNRDMQLIFLKGMTTMVDKFGKLSSLVSSSRDSQSDERREETPNTPPTHVETGTSREEQITRISRPKLIKLIEEVVKRSGKRIRLEIVGKELARREYRLTSQTKFKHFMDFLKSELRSLDLLYVIDPKEKPSYAIGEATKQKHKFYVRDILINRLDQSYYSRINKVKDPVEILNKIQDIKRYETNLTPMTIRHQLYGKRYAPHRETAAQFWDRFEELVWNHDAIPDVAPLSKDEKRDAFHKAIIRVAPQSRAVEFLPKTGKRLAYDLLKAFIIQHAANENSAINVGPTALHVKRQDSRKRNYSYGD
ncbi:hypothetical protein M0802_012379 [Mischocyttarus mexicanus]|nr:hypothetical protein M0802_012379 [Mischocyttarus mexicanus]